MKKYISIVFIIILLSLFLTLNISALKKGNHPDLKTTTTKIESSSDSILDKILIKGVEKEISVKKLVSHLGFNLFYVDVFNVSRLSNGSINISLKDNEKNYILIEKLQESEYYKEYDELNTKEIVDRNYLVNYKFLKGNILTYLKITKSIDINSQKYEEINAYLDYMISSLVLTS
ncbi:MAG: hypothetical protein OSJ65_06840 [Bacilli bacterium]|nr:hypothetical protein [Bacilli bacterium]